MKPYTAPTLDVLGSLGELTQKSGSALDAGTQAPDQTNFTAEELEILREKGYNV